MRKLLVLGAVVGLLSVALVPSTASAHVCCKRGMQAFGSPASGPPFTSLQFKVTSKLRRCRVGIKVKLFRNGSLFKAARTNSKGLAVMFNGGQPFPAGNYQARIRRRILVKTARHIHGCPRVVVSFQLP